MTFTTWLAWGEWRAQPVRNALSVAAIAIGVALGFAVHLVNAVALERFTGGLTRLRGAADLQVITTRPAGFDEALYATVARVPGVLVASPVVQRTVTSTDDPAIAVRIDGVDALKAVRVTPLLVGRPGGGTADTPSAATLAWFATDAIWVAPSLLAATGKSIGDRLAIRVDGDTVALRIAGMLDDAIDDAAPTTAPGGPRTAQAVMDIAAAQWRLGRLGRLSRIDLRLSEGSDGSRVRAALLALLPADATVTSADDDRARTGDLSRAYRVNLDMLALMALFTGAFLVYSTQSLAVARRRAQLALLRVIGATRSRVVGQVIAEGMLQGLVGGLVGLAAGIGFAALALRFFGGDLGGGYFARTGLDLHRLLFAAPEAALLFFVLGLVAALVGSFFPARDAARAAPAAALKSAGSDVDMGRVAPWTAAGLIGSGIGCALLPPIAGLPIAGYGAMALLLFGGIAAMPWVAQRLLAPFAGSRTRTFNPALDLALRRLRAAPSAASVALCGIVASASLMVAMTVMIASFRHSVDAWLTQILSADVYLRSSVAGDGLTTVDVERLGRVDGVARVDLQKAVPLVLSPTRPAVTLIARTLDATDPERGLSLVRGTRPDPADGTVPIWVSEAMVDLYGAKIGGTFALPVSHDRYRVVGVWRDYARQFGSIVMRRDDYIRATHDERFGDAAITLAPGANATATIERLRAALPDRLRARAEFAEPSAIRQLSLDIFDRSFAVTYLLQAVSIAIGLAGVAATFSAQTLARAKEFGMLRHIGVLKSQIVAELAHEGALLGTLGACAGGLLGLAMSQVLIHVVNPQSFHWTMDTDVPWRTLAIVGFALVAASAGTAVLSGRRALTHDAVLAVREDW